MFHVSPKSRRIAGLGGALAAFALVTGAAAYAQQASPLAQEIMRKVAANETEGGFCATTGWPDGNAETNRAFREGAVVGSTTVDTFNNATLCATARVTDVYFRDGRKCLRYQWWACERGKTCGGGTTLTCKSASGAWEDVKS